MFINLGPAVENPKMAIKPIKHANIRYEAGN